MLKLSNCGVRIVEQTFRSTNLVRFATFEVDLRTGELRKAGVKLKFGGQPFQVLAILLERPGDIFTREELQKRLWPDTFVDVERNLNTAVNKIREVLGDSAESPRYVETLPRRGYRFIGKVNGTDQTAGRERSGPRSWKALVWIGVTVATFAIVIVGVLIYLNAGGWRDRLFAPSPQVHALAVLPLENLSNASEQEYFSDGMTAALITELGKIGGPRVISRQSIMQFKGSKKPLREIAQELGVDAVVEGSVQRSGDRVHISVHLNKIDPERQLWAQDYDRDTGDVLHIQAEITRSIADEIKIKLTPKEQRDLAARGPMNPEALKEYLQGLYYESKTAANLDLALSHVKVSIQLDPKFAPAYAELAIIYYWMAHPNNGELPVLEMMPLATQAATKALQLDPALPQAHFILGLLATSVYDWDEAEAQYRAALALNPNYAECHHQYGVLFEAFGRNEEAVAQVKIAIELDPLSDSNRNQLGVIAFTSRNYDLAIAELENLHEAAWPAPLAMSYAHKKMFPKALAVMEKCESSGTAADFCITIRAQIYGLSGNKREASKILDQLMERSRDHYIFPILYVHAYLAVDDKEQALKWLEKAYDEKDPWLFWLKVSPDYDQLRAEPRFQALLRKANFSN